MTHKVIFIDTETTSADAARCGLIQLSGIIEIDGKVAEEFDIRSSIFDGDKWDEGAFEKNGYTLEMIRKFPRPLVAFTTFCKIMGKYVDRYDKTDKFIAVAYKADFDNSVLREWFRKNGNDFFGAWFWHPWIDLMNLAAYAYQDQRSQLENFKLATVAKFAGIPVDEAGLHDSLYDIRLTRRLYYAVAGGGNELGN